MVSREQLLDRGVHRRSIDRALRAGRLHRLHRGVYAVGHTALSREARWMAATLAAGPEAVLSHRSAAHLWGVSSRSPAVADVTTPRTPRAIEGVAVHRTRRLGPRDRTRRSGIPTTTLPRTLTDLGGAPDYDRLLHQAEILFGAQELSAARIPGRKLAASDRDRSRSALERDFKRLCRRAGIAEPENNVRVAGLEVDFLWREERVVAELDGWRFHRSRHAFELDRARDQRLKRAGYDVIRFTYRQVSDEPGRVAATVRAALASAA